MMTIIDETKRLIEEYKDNKVEITEGLIYSQTDTIKKIDYYSNSKYLSGERDRNGMLKPFYNIVNAAVMTAVRATDFDTKDIQLIATKPENSVKTMLLRHELKLWMKENNFAKTLNDMGRTRARYGGLLVKKYEKDGDIDIEVVPWKNVLTDQIDILSNPVVMVHYMTQTEMAKMRGAWEGLDENWEDIMSLYEEGNEQTTTTFREKAGGEGEGTLRVRVLEIEGEMRKQYVDEDAEEWEFSLQRHYVIIGHGQDGSYILDSQEIKDSYYKYISWETVDGRGLGRGVVEDGFEAQRWSNDMKIKEARLGDFAALQIYKTDDEMVYDNLLTDLNPGDVIKLQQGDITPLNTTSPAINVFGNIKADWQSQYQTATSTFAAITGEELPSNTPLGVVQIQNQEARSIFDYRREEMGIFLKEILTDWILPVLVKKINKDHILNSDFSAAEIKMIDQSFAIETANEKIKKMILEGEIVTSTEYDLAAAEVTTTLQAGGDRRFVEVPAGYYDNAMEEMDIVITNEGVNKATTLQTLTSLIQFATPETLSNPISARLLARAIEMAGVGVPSAEIMTQMQQIQSQQGAASAPAGRELVEAATTEEEVAPAETGIQA